MAIDVKIHVPDQLFDIEALEDALDRVLHNIAWEAEDFWKTIAGQRLKTTRKEYQDAIRTTGTATQGTISIVLEGGFLPHALELGTPGYPMHVRRGQIVPLNVNRQIIFTSPEVWATGTGQPWMHPGFPGFNMRNDVVDHIRDVLAPKYIGEALEKL
jgi:hypothetical protein